MGNHISRIYRQSVSRYQGLIPNKDCLCIDACSCGYIHIYIYIYIMCMYICLYGIFVQMPQSKQKCTHVHVYLFNLYIYKYIYPFICKIYKDKLVSKPFRYVKQIVKFPISATLGVGNCGKFKYNPNNVFAHAPRCLIY